MIINKVKFTVVVIALMTISSTSIADEVYRLRMFFGLSLPGGGAVSLNDWQVFER